MKALILLLCWFSSVTVPLRAADILYSNKFGEAKFAPWQCLWKDPKPGAHAMHAIVERNDGRHGAVNPAWVIVRHAEHRP